MTVNYRAIYEKAFGTIPVDEDGRTYDIHHWDGDRTNNDIGNLWAFRIQDHYDIHWWLGDYGACYKIAQKMRKSPEELSKIASEWARDRVAKGTHHFQDKHAATERNLRFLAEGRHPTQDKECIKKWRQKAIERLARGDHNFLTDPPIKGRHWFNDGKTNVMRTECPEGFISGQIRCDPRDDKEDP